MEATRTTYDNVRKIDKLRHANRGPAPVSTRVMPFRPSVGHVSAVGGPLQHRSRYHRQERHTSSPSVVASHNNNNYNTRANDRRYFPVCYNDKQPAVEDEQIHQTDIHDVTAIPRKQRSLNLNFKSLSHDKRPSSSNCHYFGTKRKQHILQSPRKVGSRKSSTDEVIEVDDAEMSNEVYTYNLPPSQPRILNECVIKNEERYTKYELAEIVNKKHFQLYEKTVECHEVIRKSRENERKINKLQAINDKLITESEEKTKELERKDRECADLETSKADNDIFIRKLESDISQLKHESALKTEEIESYKESVMKYQCAITNQKRTTAKQYDNHSVTLDRLQKELDSTRARFSRDIEQKNMLIRQLEVTLDQKVDSVNSLIRDKNMVDKMLLNTQSDLKVSTMLSSSRESQLNNCLKQMEILKSRLEKVKPYLNDDGCFFIFINFPLCDNVKLKLANNLKSFC